MEATRMPALFVGHGSPTNAIEDNQFSRGWHDLAGRLPRPTAILCVSAHWQTWGTAVTAMSQPRTIHDFGGFPAEMYSVEYPAPGDPALAHTIRRMITTTEVGVDVDWGLDHGAWSVLRRMYPIADIPVVQLSLDYSTSARAHYDMGSALAPLRDEGVLIVGSGNIVHNLARVVLPHNDLADLSAPYGLDWALEASALIKGLIDSRDHDALIDYQSLGRAVRLAVPTPDHYLPLLYVLALQGDDDTIAYFNDEAVAGSVTMTCVVVDAA